MGNEQLNITDDQHATADGYTHAKHPLRPLHTGGKLTQNVLLLGHEVAKPEDELSLIHISSMPKEVATGYRIGTIIYMAEFASIKQPAISRMMLTINRKMYLLPAETC